MNKLRVAEYKQRDWLDWLAITEFVVNNKVHVATKVLSFIAKYKRKLKVKTDIRKKEKIEEVIEFTERIRKVQEKAGAVLRKTQEKMKRQANK